MSVKGTQNYVWFTAERLGRGAMGNVYLARNRKKGTKFAAKVFTQETKSLPRDYITIELDILKYLPRHDNVIKFVAVEEETYSKDKVFIMELCEAGSLQSILDKPENFFGLPEDELFLVFQHIASGLEHLYLHKVVHRDVKPGNILLQTTPDGRHVYKLIDFGAACRLDKDDKGFKTLCGTEEYLHPEMHQAAFIRRVPGQVYGYNVDLWSFGVTFYQCASGSLPFVPKDGIRQDKTTMHRLMSDRSPEVISQVQKADGTIEKSSDLPKTCPLSRGARVKVLLYIRRLLNVHEPVEPSGFFSDVREFFLHMKVHVYCLEWRELITVFIKPQHTLIHLHEAIAMVTSVPASRQTLLLPEGPLESYISPGDTVKDFLNTSPQSPILLSINSYTVDPTDVWNPFLRDVPNYAPGMDLSADAKFAKEACGIVCYYLCMIQTIVLSIQHMYAMDLAYSSTIITQCQKLELVMSTRRQSLDTLVRMAAALQTRLERAETRHRAGCDCLAAARDGQHSVREKLQQLQAIHAQLDRVYHQQRAHVPSRSPAIRRNIEEPACVICRCEEKGRKIVEEAMALYHILRTDKTKELSHNDLEIHKYSRSEKKRCCRRMKELAEEHCVRELLKKHTEKLDSIKMKSSTKNELTKLERRVAKCGEDHQKLYEEICKMQESWDLSVSCADHFTTTSSMDEELMTVPDISLVEGIISEPSSPLPTSRPLIERARDSGMPTSAMFSWSDLNITPSSHGADSTTPLIDDMSIISFRSDDTPHVGMVSNTCTASGRDNPGYDDSMDLRSDTLRRDCVDGTGLSRGVSTGRERRTNCPLVTDRVPLEKSPFVGTGLVPRTAQPRESEDGYIRLADSHNSGANAYVQAKLRPMKEELTLLCEQLESNSRTLKAINEFLDHG